MSKRERERVREGDRIWRGEDDWMRPAWRQGWIVHDGLLVRSELTLIHQHPSARNLPVGVQTGPCTGPPNGENLVSSSVCVRSCGFRSEIAKSGQLDSDKWVVTAEMIGNARVATVRHIHGFRQTLFELFHHIASVF